jgi:hypothetical protein
MDGGRRQQGGSGDNDGGKAMFPIHICVSAMF